MALGLVLVALAEGVARLVPPPDGATPLGDTVEGTVLLNGDPWLLWGLRPGDHDELGVTVHVNTVGMRDRDRGPKAGPRALALGDSSVYGFGVRDDEVFTSRLEAEGPGEFINAAVPGYSTWQVLNLLDMRGWALEPDLLIVGTLWSDNNFDSFTDRTLLSAYASWQAGPSHRIRLLLEGSALFRRLDWELRVRPAGERARKVGWQVGGDDPRTGDRRVAIQDYATNLDTLCARAQAHGSGVLFLLLANREDIDARSPDPAWGPYRQVLRDTASRWGAPIADIPRVFNASGETADKLFLDQMHPTPLGHRLMATAVRAALIERRWPDRPIELVTPSTPLPRYEDRFAGKGGEEPAGNHPR